MYIDCGVSVNKSEMCDMCENTIIQEVEPGEPEVLVTEVNKAQCGVVTGMVVHGKDMCKNFIDHLDMVEMKLGELGCLAPYKELLLDEQYSDREGPPIPEAMKKEGQPKYPGRDTGTQNVFVQLHNQVMKGGTPMRGGACIPIGSKLNIPLFRALLSEYADIGLVDWLEFSWPVS